MLELPEAVVVAQQMNETVKGKKVLNVTAAHTPHKFAWYTGNPSEYHSLLSGKTVGQTTACASNLEIQIDDRILMIGAGLCPRYHGVSEAYPKKHQLLVEFEDGSALSATVQMWGGMFCFPKGESGGFTDYQYAKIRPSLLSSGFNKAYFDSLFDEATDKLSLKAFLATEQRIPGLGNGVLQDILFNAKMHPKKKVNTLSVEDKDVLFHAIKSTLSEMTIHGGRDTERDFFNCLGGYKTILCKNTVGKPCPVCKSIIQKEAYMGGSIYVCEECQRR